MSSLHKRNGSNNNNNGGSSSFFFSEEEEESSSSPLKSPMTATAAAPSHRTSNNGSSIGGSSSVLLRSSPRSSPNNKSSSMNSKEKKNKTTSSVALLIKYLFLAILILLVYFLLRINLQLIQRERAKRVSFSLYNTQNGAVIATTVNGKQVGGKSSPLRARSSNNDAQQQEEEEGQDAEKLLHNRLVTLRSEVATMQKKVDDMKKRIGHIKDIRKSSVELSTKKNNDNNEELLRHTCTPDQTTLQTQRLQKRFAEWWSHSACPDQIWMEHIDDLFAQVTPPPSSSSQNEKQPQQPPYLILDIGCNKGYTSADFLDALSPGTNMNPSTLVTAIRSVAKEDNTKYDRDGGVCNDSKKTLNQDRRTVRDVEVHCFEPSPATYDMLTRVHDKLMPNDNEEEKKGGGGGGGGGGAKWFIHNKGLHKVNGEMTWHSACAHAVGDELCTIVKEGTKDAITVPVVTVDKFLEETYPSSSSSSTLDSSSSLPLVHMLKIDAEGLDPAVLEGSRNLLTQNRAIMVMFEFNPGLSEKGDHPHGMWGKKGNPHVTLLQVTNWLDTLGYDCYLDTHVPDEQEKKKDTKGVLEEAPGLYRITGDCLSKEPSVRGWANVVCASRKYGVVAKRLLELATIVAT